MNFHIKYYWYEYASTIKLNMSYSRSVVGALFRVGALWLVPLALHEGGLPDDDGFLFALRRCVLVY